MKNKAAERIAIPEKDTSPSRWREAPQWNEALDGELLRVAQSRGAAVAKAYVERVYGIHPKAIERRLRQLQPEPGPPPRSGRLSGREVWKENEGETLADLLEGTATLTSIAQRLSNLNRREPVRSAAAVRSKLWRSERAMSLPGFKAAEVAEMLGVQKRQVKRWTDNGYLETKAGRISEASLERLLKDRSHLVPFARLGREQQDLLVSFGYRANRQVAKRPARLRATAKQVEQLLAGAGKRVTQREVALLMGVSVRQVRHWVERGWLNGRSVLSMEDLRELVRVHPRLLDSAPDRVRQHLTSGGSEGGND